MTIFSDAILFFQSLENTSPALSGITQQAQALSASFDAAAPAIATQAANAALAMIPSGMGALAAPLADEIIDRTVTALLAKKSAAVAAAAASIAQVQS